MTDLEPVRRRYRQFAETECRGYSALYHRLALEAADDESIVRFIAARPAIQPNLFFAAVQFVTGLEGMPSDGTQLAAAVRDRGPEIAEVMATHRTQTNEVGRCAVLVAAMPHGPLALLEVGASAGLCLLLDQFFYDFGATRIGDPSSLVRIECAVDGIGAPSFSLPEVAWRRGLDVAPIDVRDDDAVRWLLACVWPDHPPRRRRLAAAIELARATPPQVVEGDLVDDLERIVDGAPDDACLVVFHSAVLPYVQPERRLAFVDRLADLSRRRDVVWISNEAPGVVSRLDPPYTPSPVFEPIATPDGALRFVVGRTTFRGAAAVDEVLALAHPHGGEITWLAGAT